MKFINETIFPDTKIIFHSGKLFQKTCLNEMFWKKIDVLSFPNFPQSFPLTSINQKLIGKYIRAFIYKMLFISAQYLFSVLRYLQIKTSCQSVHFKSHQPNRSQKNGLNVLITLISRSNHIFL